MKILTVLALCGLVSGQSQRNLYGNSDSARSSLARQHKNTAGPRMSLKLARTINSLGSVDEFLKMINDRQPGSQSVFIGNRFGGVERSNAIVAKPALCTPELKTVPLDTDNNDSAVFYFPSCTRIKQCGGCCHSLFSCQPKETVTRNFEVIVSRLTADGDVTAHERKIIPLEEHERCECDCRMKAEDCNVKQKYFKEDCECRCMNNDEEEKCDRNSDLKYWDPTTCSCHCWQELMCNLGSYFNPDTCRCDRQQVTRRFGTDRGTDYRSREKSRDALPEIVPFEIDTRRRSNKDDPEYK